MVVGASARWLHSRFESQALLCAAATAAATCRLPEHRLDSCQLHLPGLRQLADVLQRGQRGLELLRQAACLRTRAFFGGLHSSFLPSQQSCQLYTCKARNYALSHPHTHQGPEGGVWWTAAWPWGWLCSSLKLVALGAQASEGALQQPYLPVLGAALSSAGRQCASQRVCLPALLFERSEQVLHGRTVKRSARCRQDSSRCSPRTLP